MAIPAGPLSDTELLDLLEDDSQPNEPARVPLPGCSGTRDFVTVPEQRKRRAVLSGLLASGASDDAIEAAMETTFGLDHRGVEHLRAEIRAAWDEEDAERKPYAKAAAVRRLRQHIRGATKRGAFTAVAMLEKQLGDVEGTAEPQRIRIEGDLRLSAAVLSVLGEMNPVKVRQIVDDEVRRLLPPAVDAVGVSVSARDREPAAP